MPNVDITDADPLRGSQDFSSEMNDSLSSTNTEAKLAGRKKKDSEPVKTESSGVVGKKRPKKEASQLEDPELIAVEALAFMFAGNAPSSKPVAPTDTAPSAAQDSMLSAGSAAKRMRLSSNSISAAQDVSPYPNGMLYTNGLLVPSSPAPVSDLVRASAGLNMMHALTEADRVISGANLAGAKRPKSASADIYVPLCRAFSRQQLTAAQLYQSTSGENFQLPPPLTVDFILEAARRYENFSRSTIESWQLALQSGVDANNFVDSLISSKDTAVKVVFSLMHCALFAQTPEGRRAWQENYANYRQSFQDTLLRVVEQDSVRDEAKNQSLLATLPLAYFCVCKLMPRLGLRDNLCLFLALISCLEGRGKYHGRAGDNLPFAHKCYRYLVEILGGKVFKSIAESDQSKADRELSKLFESHDTFPATVVAAAVPPPPSHSSSGHAMTSATALAIAAALPSLHGGYLAPSSSSTTSSQLLGPGLAAAATSTGLSSSIAALAKASGAVAPTKSLVAAALLESVVPASLGAAAPAFATCQ